MELLPGTNPITFIGEDYRSIDPKILYKTMDSKSILENEFRDMFYYPKTNLYAIHDKSLINFDEYIKVLSNFNLPFCNEKSRP